LGFDPLLKEVGSNDKSKVVFKSRIQRFLAYSPKVQKWVGLWALADGNAAVVRRSLVLNKYSDDLKYSESAIFPNFMQGCNFYLFGLWNATVLYNSWIRELWYKNLMK
jgi:hypothetical protein